MAPFLVPVANEGLQEYSEYPSKHGIILVVTIIGRGPDPRFHCFLFEENLMDRSVSFSIF